MDEENFPPHLPFRFGHQVYYIPEDDMLGALSGEGGITAVYSVLGFGDRLVPLGDDTADFVARAVEERLSEVRGGFGLNCGEGIEGVEPQAYRRSEYGNLAVRSSEAFLLQLLREEGEREATRDGREPCPRYRY